MNDAMSIMLRNRVNNIVSSQNSQPMNQIEQNLANYCLLLGIPDDFSTQDILDQLAGKLNLRPLKHSWKEE